MPNPAVLEAAAAGVVLEPLAGRTLADRSPPADATPEAETSAELTILARPRDDAETYVLLQRDGPPETANLTLSGGELQLRFDHDSWRSLNPDADDAYYLGHHQEPLYFTTLGGRPFLEAAAGRERLTLDLPDWQGRPIIVGFDLDGLFDTPVKPNLDSCGSY